MKALSVKQPWASLIATGHKTIETRTWKTNYRGPLLIVSSQAVDEGAMAAFYPPWASSPSMPRGFALCTAELVDCRKMDWLDEKAALCMAGVSTFAWVLANVKVVEPKLVKGKLGLYEVEWP